DLADPDVARELCAHAQSLRGSVPGPESGDDQAERSGDVGSFESDLGMGESEGRQARCGVRLITNVVAGLLSRSAVIAEAVGLDDKPQVRQIEVDPEAVQPLAGQGKRQAC